MTGRVTRLGGGRALAAAGFAAATLALGACQSTSLSDAQDLQPAEQPDVLYNKGLALLRDGEVKDARAEFEEIDKQHPYSEYSRRAMIMTAYADFKRGDYQEAINNARRYVTLYPQTPDAAYAQYLIGESYFRQIPDVTRDQELSQKAIDEMSKVAELYPDSEYADDARKKVQIAQDQIAGREMQVGRYYLERRDFLAAINRFKVVASRHQTTRHVEEALHRLTEAYLALGVVPEAQNAAAVLGHNFPDSPWYKESYRLLAKGGVEPRESGRSWLTRAFRSRPAA